MLNAITIGVLTVVLTSIGALAYANPKGYAKLFPILFWGNLTISTCIYTHLTTKKNTLTFMSNIEYSKGSNLDKMIQDINYNITCLWIVFVISMLIIFLLPLLEKLKNEKDD